jgi:iron complex transport system substrate-binding protein
MFEVKTLLPLKQIRSAFSDQTYNIQRLLHRLKPHMFRFLFLAALTLCLTTACNGNFSQTSTTLTPQSSSSDCRIVKHAIDQTCVPLQPQRVVTLNNVGNALALGVKPVGGFMDAEVQSYPYLKNQLTDIKNTFSRGQPNLEMILTLQPDLILGSSPYHNEIYGRLMQIAPTVLADYQTNKDWKNVLMKEAEALGKSDRAQQLMADYRARLEQFKAQMGDRLSQIEVSVIRLNPEGVSLYTIDGFVSSILQDAGLRYPPVQAQYASGTVPLERIRDIDASVIFVWAYNTSAAIAQQTQAVLEKLKADPLWQQLKAVQQNKVYEVPGYWIGDSILEAEAVVDDLFKYLVFQKT